MRLLPYFTVLWITLAGFTSLTAAPPHYFVVTAAGTVPPLTNSLAANQYLDQPSAVAYDPHGVLYYATVNRLWRLNADGTDTPITAPTSFSSISSMACDPQGNLYVADNGQIWKIAPSLQVALLPTPSFQFGVYIVAADGSGNVYASGYSGNTILQYSAGAQNWTPAAQLATNDTVTGMAAAGNNLYITHGANQSEVRQIDLRSGTSSVVLQFPSGVYVFAITAGPTGAIYGASSGLIYEGSPGSQVQQIAGTAGVPGYSGDGGPATQANIAPGGTETSPGVLAVNPANGDVAISESSNHVFRVISAATHTIRTVAGQPHYGGDNGPAVLARFDTSVGALSSGAMAADRSGNVYLFDRNNARIRQISFSGIVTAFAGAGVPGSSGDGGKATQANINGGNGDGTMAVDAAGNLYFVNSGNGDTVRMVDTKGNIHTVAGGGTSPITNGAAATSVNLGSVLSITVDASGNLFLAQSSSITSGKSQIFKMNSSGMLSLVAGSLNNGFNYAQDGTPATNAFIGRVFSMATDSAGLLYYCGFDENLIRMVNAQGNLVTIAGRHTGILYLNPVTAGPARNADLSYPKSMLLDAAGNVLFVNESFNGPQIVMVDTSGNLTPIGGNPSATGTSAEQTAGDGGDSLKAGFTTVDALTLDPAGNIYALDNGVYVRKLSPYDPTNPPPFLSTGGVVGAGGSVPAVMAVSPDGEATVFGANFGVAHTLSGADLVNGKVPTTLAGVCVNFGSAPAAVLGVYPNQVNVQVPSLPPGPVTVEVTLKCGMPNAVASNFGGVIVQAASPEFYSFVPDPVAGHNPIAAINPLTGGFIGAPGLLPGGTFAPAAAGSYVEAYGTGWGLTSPALGLGVIPGGAVNLAASYTLALGGVTVPTSNILYAGASACCAGLYQIDFQVPQGTPSGNQPLVISVGGVASAPTAFITVQ